MDVYCHLLRLWSSNWTLTEQNLENKKIVTVTTKSFSWPTPLLVLNLSTCLTIEEMENTWTGDMTFQFADLVKMNMRWAKFHKKKKSYLTCNIYHLLSPDIKYVRLRRKTRLEIALLIWDIPKCTSNHVHISDIITRQAETHESSFPSNWVCARERVHAAFEINWLSLSQRGLRTN